ncbi:MAG: hypothetical protein LBV46_03320 [Bacteroidales bacterium]|nr:hypothetical protein [Bacteroidales bacterium]
MLVSCNTGDYKESNQVEQRTIFPQYSVTVDAATGKCVAMVNFRVDNSAGFAVVLSEKSAVSCNNQGLTLDKNSEDFSYSLTMESIPTQIKFVYTNDDGKTFENSFDLSPIAFVAQSITISKSAGGSFFYSGSTVKDDETVILKWMQGEKIIEELVPEVLSNKRLAVNAELLSELSVGSYTCRIVRETVSSEVKALDRGAIFTSDYESNPIKIIIVE